MFSFAKLLSKLSGRKLQDNKLRLPDVLVDDAEVERLIRSIPKHYGLIASQFGNIPGLGPEVETYEAAVTFGNASQLKWFSGQIFANAVDSGNSPTWRLRPGLVLGLQNATSGGAWSNYNPVATDGTQIAAGILAYGLRMQDVLTGLNTTKFYAIVVGGNVKTANLIGLDQQAISQMADRFVFDSNIIGNSWFPWRNQLTKTAAYSIQQTDNGATFNNFGATGAVPLTLPPILNGYEFGVSVQADQTLSITSFEGGNIIALNNLVANTLSFQTGGARIGGQLQIYSNPAGAKWIAESRSIGAATLTVS